MANTFCSREQKAKRRRKEWQPNMNNLLNDYNHQNIFVTRSRATKKEISIGKMWDTCGFYAEKETPRMGSRREHTLERFAKSIVVLRTVRAFKSFSVDSKASTLP